MLIFSTKRNTMLAFHSEFSQRSQWHHNYALGEAHSQKVMAHVKPSHHEQLPSKSRPLCLSVVYKFWNHCGLQL